MVVTSANVRWGKYANYEGPVFGGVQKYVLPERPAENDRIMNVVTAAEGGSFDAVNMYDSGIVSVGLIQWINSGQHSVDAMLGRVVTDCGEDKVLGPLAEALSRSSATFKKNSAGQWRFFNAAGEVSSDAQQRNLFMLGCGARGTWHPAAIEHAKIWAAGFANVFADPKAQKAQVDYTVPRLKEFLFGDVKNSLYDGKPDEGWVGAARAAVISFAVNLPGKTAPLYKAYVAYTSSPKWSSDWVIGLLKHLTFNGPSTNIWLMRYNEIRPVLELLYGVKLPKTSSELSTWKPTGMHVDADPIIQPAEVELPPPPVVDPPKPVVVEPATPVEPDQPLPPVPIVPVSPFRSFIEFLMMIINFVLRKKN